MVFLVSYDLNVDNNNNQKVRTAISSLGCCNPCLESSYLLQTNLDSGGVYREIVKVLGPGDAVFVTPVRYDDCSGRTASVKGVWEWFRDHSL